MGQSRRRVSTHRTRTQTQTRNSKKTNLRKKNKSRRGSYTKKRKVMVGGTLLSQDGWNELTPNQKQDIINSIEDINELKIYSGYEDSPNITDKTIGNSIDKRISKISPPPPPPPPPPPLSQPLSQPPPPPPPPPLDENENSDTQSNITIHDIPVDYIPVETIEQKMNPRTVICKCNPRQKSKPTQRPQVSKKTQSK